MSASKGTNNSPWELRFAGQRIALKTSQKDPEIADEVLSLVSSRLKKAEGRTRASAPHHIALLALLDLAEEYAAAKRRTQDYQNEVAAKAGEILKQLENPSQ